MPTGRWVLLMPFGLGLGLLVAELLFGEMERLRAMATIALVPALVALLVGTWVLARRSGRWNESPLVAVAMATCALVPLGVATAWEVGPDPLGMSYGSFAFFLDWLTRYPNLGPINYEVLAGIACMLGASSLPVAFAWYRLQAETPRRRVLAVLSGLHFTAYLPLLVRLDFLQLAYAAAVLVAGPMTIAGDTHVPLAARFEIAGEASGALLRLMATLAMSFVLLRSFLPRHEVEDVKQSVLRHPIA